MKAGLCKNYQLATQSLCSDVRLHSRSQGGRHENQDFMEYGRVKDGSDDSDSDDLMNRKAYEMSELVKDEERVGVAHLVHGWIQQGQAEKVRDMMRVIIITDGIVRDYTYRRIYHVQAAA